jgi:Domain of unknown function (DUF3883)
MRSDFPAVDNLGTEQLFNIIIFEIFKNSSPVTIKDITEYCVSKIYRVSPHVQPTLEFLKWLEVLSKDGPNYIPYNHFESLVTLNSSDDLAVRLVCLLFEQLHKSDITSLLFPSGSITRNSTTKDYYLVSSKIPGVWTGIVVLLRNLKLAHSDMPGTGLLRLDKKISQYVESAVLEAQSLFPPVKHRFSLDQLKQLHIRQEEQALKAESFVVAYERRRLSNHQRPSLIRSISNEDTGAGFDVVSFETDSSIVYDRFIEVKSYKRNFLFYWSRGEYESAKRLGYSYYIYLVDVNKLDKQDYVPIIIQNPVEIMADSQFGWKMEPESWCVTKN